MGVWIRIMLYLASGWLYGKGMIGEEVKDLITTDPAMVESIEAAVAMIVAGVPMAWWRLAKRLGWAT